MDSAKLSLENDLDLVIDRSFKALLDYQDKDGYWCFELEADCTVPAEYILMTHFTGETDEELEAKIAVYLRSHQCYDGGWSLFYGGEFDLSCSVKAYYALKLAGDSPDAPHMVQAREAILARGGRLTHQCSHPLHSCAFRPDSLESGAISSSGNSVYAALVSFPLQQGILLVTHRDDSPFNFVFPEAGGQKPGAG